MCVESLRSLRKVYADLRPTILAVLYDSHISLRCYESRRQSVVKNKASSTSKQEFRIWAKIGQDGWMAIAQWLNEFGWNLVGRWYLIFIHRVLFSTIKTSTPQIYNIIHLHMHNISYLWDQYPKVSLVFFKMSFS